MHSSMPTSAVVVVRMVMESDNMDVQEVQQILDAGNPNHR